SVFALVKLLSGSLFLLLVGTHLNWGVAWHRFSAFFNIYFKREADGGVALGALKPMMSGGKVLEMETADPDVDAFGAGKIEDFSWKGWLDFTTCTECGRCQSQCPAWNTGKPLSPKLLIMSLRDHGYAKAPYLLAGGSKDMGGDEVGLVDADGNVLSDKLDAIPAKARAEAERKLVGESAGTGTVDDDMLGAVIDTETLWSCTTCGACVEQCPVDIEHVDHIVDMRRYQVLIESDFPSELAGLFKNLENKGNPWGQSTANRTAWIDEMDIEIPVYGQDVESFEGFEYLFWVGCAGAYEDRAKKTTKAVAELLDTAAVNFLVLGQGETCTGDSARRAGNEFLFQMLAQQNIEQFDDLFATAPQQRKKIVVTCAHCFNALNNEYPQVDAERGTFEVVHHTQLLNRLVREKRLVPVAPVDGQKVTYHDPCYLGRHNKIYDAPRELMEASGSTLTEMPRHGERSMCCGAGGARMWMEEQIGKRINIDRVDEALDSLGAQSGPAGATGEAAAGTKIATGCPFCRVMLTDGVTARISGTELEDKVEVVDVAQMLLEGVRRGQPTEIQRGGKVHNPASVAVASVAAPAPAKEEKEAPAKAAPAASGGAPKAKVGLAMKGGLKKPGGAAPAASAGAPAAAPAEKKPAAKGFGMAAGKKPGGAPGAAASTPAADAAPAEKKPAAKGFGMAAGKKPGAAGAKAPGTAQAEAPAADAAEAAAPAAPKAKGFGMAAGKKPGVGAKAPGAAAPAPAAEAPAADAAPADEAQAAAPAAPKAKGFGMAAGKKPGVGAKAPAPAPAAAPAEEAAEPVEEAVAEAPAEAAPATAGTATAGTATATTEATTSKAKGFGMAAGKRRPGVAATAAAPAVAAASGEEAAPADDEPAEAESTDVVADAPAEEAPADTAAATETPNQAVTEATEAKAKGFGLAAGKKRPGQR
ncbi:hypothetical protein GOEFS_024_00080, partial [Gordonia effusa NBRC 100432]